MNLSLRHLLICLGSTLAILCFLDLKVRATTPDKIEPKHSTTYKSLTINNPQLARLNWLLNCQGCHKKGAFGLEPSMPNLNGKVSKLLHVEGGREYIGHVNGITNAPLADDDLADLVNWMFMTYDPQNIPDDFSGFSAHEIGEMRKTPLKTDILIRREKLARAIKKLSIEDRTQSQD